MSSPVDFVSQLIGSLTGGNNNRATFSVSGLDGVRPGDTVNARVNIGLGGNKYSININGKAFVGESDVPLRADEVLHGRVIGVGDKVELQRIFKEKAHADKYSGEQQNWQELSKAGGEGVRAIEVLQSYRVSLNSAEQQLLGSLLRASSEPEALVLSVIVVNKLGLPISQSSINTIFPSLSKSLNERFNLQGTAAYLKFADSAEKAVMDGDTMKQLSAFVASVINELPEKSARLHLQAQQPDAMAADEQLNMNATTDDSSTDSGRDDSDARLFDSRRLMLNSQNDGSVAHRVTVIPFFINNQLIEVDVALFSQKQSHDDMASLSYKKIVMSLDLDELGHVEIEIQLANKNARVAINADSAVATNELVRYMPVLKQNLNEYALNIDELSYGTVHKDSLNNVINSVVDHYITQDSLNRAY